MPLLSHVMRYGSLVMLLCVLGCGGAAGPKLAPVKGKVTVGGSEPFKHGLVRFIPPPTSTLNMREATTDEQGNYTILFSPGKPGLEPGAYTVMLSLYQMPDGSPPPDQTGNPDPKSPDKLGAVQWVPKEFELGTNEKCKVTISDKGGEFNFDIPELKPQGKGK